ncbi:MAG TPA: M24 family metallopeptidase, partial [Chthonomonadaceae bacterium]|nr:M24 family metallopeptidase [Chthonomonadaceae bacterium]
MNEYQGRIARLQELMRDAEARLTVVAGTDQMRYLTGWREGGHERFVGLLVPIVGDPVFVVPAMNAPQAALTPAGIQQVIGWEDGVGWHEAVQNLLAQWRVAGADTALVDDEMLSVHLLAMQHLFPNMYWEAAGPVLAKLRESKTPDELAAMQKAADLIDGVFEETLGALKEGMTERDLAEFVLAAIKSKGSSPSFSPLICFGANAALPHHHTGDARLKRGDV